MKQHKKKIITALAIVLVGIIAWLFFQKHTANVSEWNGENVTPENWQSAVKKMDRQTLGQIYLKKMKEDYSFDWRIPIRFYGKVLNQFDQPVAGAIVEIRWTDTSADGASERTLSTDSLGKFSLEGVLGKRLWVDAKKEGYYDMSRQENSVRFEYANPSEDIYHEPDPQKPVKFLMRKKGTPAKLVSGKVLLQLPGQEASGSVDFFANNGKGKAVPLGEGQLQVTTSKPQYPPTLQFPPYPYDWAIKLMFSEGGFIANNDLFPFLAPESGYQATLDEKFHAVATSQYGRSFDRKFYFRIGKPPYNYGRIKIVSAASRDHTSISYSLNPTPGDRNLEPTDWK